MPARGGGTSFSSPVIAGAVAVLWQAYPEMPAEDVIRYVLNSSDRFKNPDINYGFGLPDFAKVFYTISATPAHMLNTRLDIYPNPAREWIMIKLPEGMNDWYQLEYYDMNGRLFHSQEVWLPGEVTLPDNLFPGIYILQIRTEKGIYRTRLIKN